MGRKGDLRMRVFEPPKYADFETLVGEAIGFASTCWDDDGQFDSESASTAVDAILAAARDYFQEKSTDIEAGPAPVDDGYLRQLALQAANQPGLNSESVLAAAEKYLAFLKG